MIKLIFMTANAPKNGVYMNDSSWEYERDFFPDELSYLAVMCNDKAQTHIRKTDKFSTDKLEAADLVYINVETHIATKSYAVADSYRQKNVPVILGGTHVTAVPEEARQHADAIVLGETKSIWTTVLDDAINGTLKQRYQGDPNFSLDGLPTGNPMFYCFKEHFSSSIKAIRTTVGSNYNPAVNTEQIMYGTRPRYRAIDKVMEEIGNLGTDSVFLSDYAFGSNPEYAHQLLLKFRENDIRSIATIVPDFYDDFQLMELTDSQRFRFVFLRLDSLNPANLGQGRKQSVADLIGLMQRFTDKGITVIPTLAIGYDHDDESTFDQVNEFVVKSGARRIIVTIATPMPGTPWFKQLEAENRLLHRNWSEYNTRNLVFKPKLLTEEQITKGYYDMMKSIVPLAFRRAVIYTNA